MFESRGFPCMVSSEAQTAGVEAICCPSDDRDGLRWWCSDLETVHAYYVRSGSLSISTTPMKCNSCDHLRGMIVYVHRLGYGRHASSLGFETWLISCICLKHSFILYGTKKVVGIEGYCWYLTCDYLILMCVARELLIYVERLWMQRPQSSYHAIARTFSRATWLLMLYIWNGNKGINKGIMRSEIIDSWLISCKEI